MRNVVQLFLAANTILLMRKWNHACSLLVHVMSQCHYFWKATRANRFPKKLFIKKQTQWSNDKTTRRSIICLKQIIDLLATDKSRHFAQPRPIIANCRVSSLWLMALTWDLRQADNRQQAPYRVSVANLIWC